MEPNLLFKDPGLLAEIARVGKVRSFDADIEIISPGFPIHFIPIVLEGAIRVMRNNEEDQDFFLYNLYPGQTCAITLTCCLAKKGSMVKSVTDDKTKLLQIPIEEAEKWERYPEWKAYTANNLNNRFIDLLNVIDLIAFHHMDEQLLNYIRERCKGIKSNILNITHQEIAGELNTHREAITRLLRTMEQKGMVKLGRNKIELMSL